jgi:SIR2-like domain
MPYFKEKEIIFLLGAGASADAQIPITSKMLNDIELELKNGWSKFAPLYDFIKCNHNGPLNIESLVSALDELQEVIEGSHSLTHFFGTFVIFLKSLGPSIDLVKEFRELIVKKLKEDWIIPKNYLNAAYYDAFVTFMKKDYKTNLHIVTLNYDLCVEERCKKLRVRVERGFGDENGEEDSHWDYNIFRYAANDNDHGARDREDNMIFLYKLHGSIDWTRENSKLLRQEVQAIKPHKLEIIFGKKQKLRSADPYLFLMFGFRELTLQSKVMVVCGYSFGDNHINEIIVQAIKSDKERILLVN